MVYITRYLDLFWTSPTKSLWNTTFKIIFIGAQCYIIYLMLTDYKPTHDPNQDTFKVEYLIGGAAVLGILFPPLYKPSEVREYHEIKLNGIALSWRNTDALGIFHLAGIGCSTTTTFHAAKNGRGRDDHNTLPLRTRRLPRALHTELDLEILR